MPTVVRSSPAQTRVSLSLDAPLGTRGAVPLSPAPASSNELAAWRFTPSRPVAGRTGRVLVVDLGCPAAWEEQVPEGVVRAFVGGRGLALWLLWRAVGSTTRWDDAANALVVSPGPLCGTAEFTGAGKASVVAISPLTGLPFDSSVGGHFGPLLKSCGFDALALVGRCAAPIDLLIDVERGRVAVLRRPSVTAGNVYDEVAALARAHAPGPLRHDVVSVLATGPAARYSPLACLHVSRFDHRRGGVRLKQAGRGGLGRVLREKGVRGVVVVGRKLAADANAAEDPGAVRAFGARVAHEVRKLDDEQNRVRRVGTTHLVEVMNAYGVLPVRNFQRGSDPAATRLASAVWEKRMARDASDACSHGCHLACSKGVDCHRVMTGPHAGRMVLVDGPEYSTCAALGSNCGIFDPDWVLEAAYYCDAYGVDTISFGGSCAFAMECRELGILTVERTGGIVLDWGSGEAQLEVLHQLARGEGFGAIVGLGVRGMQALFALRGWGDPALLADIGMQLKGLEYSPYVAQESPAQQAGYALASKGPQHDEAWLIFLDMVNRQLPDVESIAEALHYYPMFRTWFGLTGLCRLPWNEIEPADNGRHGHEAVKVPEHVENYCRLYTATTGEALTAEGLILQSERVYTFQRLFNARMGAGRRNDDLPPWRALGPVTADEYERHAERYDAELAELTEPGRLTVEERIRLLQWVRRAQFDRIARAAYRRRGWTPAGVPTADTLQRLRLDDETLLAVIQPDRGEERLLALA
jgi:aldehyde:ferredoxin oxidoreductase